MLSETGRKLIEKNFGCIVYATYQTVETGKIGFQCERREGFHLNIDLSPFDSLMNQVRRLGLATGRSRCVEPV